VLVGVGDGEGVKVEMADTVGYRGAGAREVAEPTVAVEKTGASPPHPTSKSRTSIDSRPECLFTIPLL
jgi:hypothetical protein